MGIFIIIITISELGILLAMKKGVLNNLQIALLYKGIFLFILFFVCSLYTFVQRSFYKKILLVLFIVLIGFLLFSGQLLNKTFDTTFGVSISLFILLVCLLWYVHKIQEVSAASIFADPFFWYSTGLFLWASVFLLRILPAQFLQFRDKEFLRLLQNLNFGVNIISNILFAIGLFKSHKINTVEPN